MTLYSDVKKMKKLIVAFSRLYEVMLAFFLLKIVSDYLIPSEYAKLNLFIAITQGVVLFFISPLQNWILVNNIKSSEENWLGSLLVFEFIYSMIISLITLMVVFFIDPPWFSLNVLFCIVLIFSIVTPILVQTVVPIFNIHHYSNIFVILSITGATFSFVFPVFFAKVVAKKYELWLLGVYLAQAALCIFAIRMLIVKNIINMNSALSKLTTLPYKQILRFSLPLSVAVGFQWYNSQGFRLQLENAISLAALGAFIMGFGFGGKFLNAIEKVFTTVLMPALYNRNENVSIKKAWMTYFFKMSAIYILSTIALYFLASNLYKILISEEYQSGVKFIAAGMMFDMFRCILNSVYQYNMITSKNGLQFIVNAIVTLMISAVIYIVFMYKLNFDIFVYAMPSIMAVVTFICFIINYLDAKKIENC